MTSHRGPSPGRTPFPPESSQGVRMTRSRILFFVALLAFAVGASSATAGPVIKRLSPPGLTTGATTSLVIVGTELVPEPRLQAPRVHAEQRGVRPERMA